MEKERIHTVILQNQNIEEWVVSNFASQPCYKFIEAPHFFLKSYETFETGLHVKKV